MSHISALSHFCRNLHVLRLRHSLSLPAMADLLDISPGELASIESGSVPQTVTVEVLWHIQKNFGIPPGQVLSTDFCP